MAIAFDRKQTRTFVPPSDRRLPTDEQTTFVIAPMSQDDFDDLQKASTVDGRPVMEQMRDTVRRALVGWKNFKLADGSQASFATDERGRPTDETLKQIRPKDLLALATDINKGETMETEDAGKS